MSTNFKAEVYSRIFEDAKTAKPIPGKPNTYEPDDYNKVRAQSLLMGLANDGEYLVPHIPHGAVEMDGNGNLKAIARNRPAMLDLNFYTRNRYEVEKVIPANEKKMGLERGTYILVLLGNPIVKAVADTVELPKTVRAFRFKKTEIEVDSEPLENNEGVQIGEVLTGDQQAVKDMNEHIKDGGEVQIEKVEDQPEKKKAIFWQYVGAEMIPSERAYKMTKSLDVKSMLALISQVEAGVLNADDEVMKDSLDEID